MNETTKSNNPFATMQQAGGGAMAGIEQGRAAQEVQAMVLVAQRFPRNQAKAMDKILQACTRKSLAEAAIYAYPRGGTQVEGPSIRCAEAIAQHWGNIQFGIRELSQASGVSEVEAFAWDLETNVRQTKTFQVRHERYTKSGGNKALSDPRDIYEMVANQGARRLRACILGIIPGDVTEAAVNQCRITQEQSVGAPDEAVAKMVTAFAEYGVTEKHIMLRLGHNLKATTAAEVLSLKRVYQSIRDGMASPSQYFDMPDDAAAPASPETEALNENLRASEKAKREKKAKQDTAPAATAETQEAAPAAEVPPTLDVIIQKMGNAGSIEALESCGKEARKLKTDDDKKAARKVFLKRKKELEAATVATNQGPEGGPFSRSEILAKLQAAETTAGIGAVLDVINSLPDGTDTEKQMKSDMKKAYLERRRAVQAAEEQQ